MPRELAEPWRSFLAELDARVEHEVVLHCCGGFVVTAVYGLARTTADLDVLAIVPSDQQRELARLARRGSMLHQTHGVYLDMVTVATLPDSYEDRLTALYPGRFRHFDCWRSIRTIWCSQRLRATQTVIAVTLNTSRPRSLLTRPFFGTVTVERCATICGCRNART